MPQLRVERSRAEHSGKGLALLHPDTMAREHLHGEDLIEIRTRYGRVALARVGPPLTEADGKGMVRVDQYVRQGLKARLGDPVEVKKAENVPTVEKLVLAPLLDVSRIQGVADFLRQQFSSNRLPAALNSVLFAAFPGAAIGWGGLSGAPFQVTEIAPGPGIVTKDTTIELKYTVPVGPETVPDVTFEDVGGLDREIRVIRELIEVPLRFPNVYRRLGINPPRGIIFHGPPGSGKTHLAKAIAHEIEAKLLYISGPEIISSAYGETEANLRRTFQEAASHFPSLVFVDELDVIAPKRGESGSAADTRMSTQFLSLLDGIKRTEGIMVIGTTNRIDSVDMSFRRPGRFDREIYIGSPDAPGRMEILQIHTRGMPLTEAAHDFQEELARVTVGYVGADFVELCREAGLSALRRHLPQEGSYVDLRNFQVPLDKLVVDKPDFEQALTKLRPSALRETMVVVSDTTWDDLGGLREAKERLREVVEQPLKQPEVFSTMKIKPPRGVLLYGPSGTGKSLLAKAVAYHCDANFIPVRGPEFFSKWLGESEERIRRIFGVARQVAPCIIFLDQIDALAPARSAETGTTGIIQRVVNQLQAEMDAVDPLKGIMVIAATNRIDLIDPAILTPGRFGVHIYVPLPDAAERAEILSVTLRGVPLAGDITVDSITSYLAGQTEGYSGAELDAIVEEAKMAAVRAVGYGRAVPLTREHFVNAQKAVARSRESRAAMAAEAGKKEAKAE
ncbi:MAG: AAA family ATPase [Chloroflexi bacterium]|nr:AAA family ATPase [Chloroflexota bacterium]